MKRFILVLLLLFICNFMTACAPGGGGSSGSGAAPTTELLPVADHTPHIYQFHLARFNYDSQEYINFQIICDEGFATETTTNFQAYGPGSNLGTLQWAGYVCGSITAKSIKVSITNTENAPNQIVYAIVYVDNNQLVRTINGSTFNLNQGESFVFKRGYATGNTP